MAADAHRVGRHVAAASVHRAHAMGGELRLSQGGSGRLHAAQRSTASIRSRHGRGEVRLYSQRRGGVGMGGRRRPAARAAPRSRRSDPPARPLPPGLRRRTCPLQRPGHAHRGGRLRSNAKTSASCWLGKGVEKERLRRRAEQLRLRTHDLSAAGGEEARPVAAGGTGRLLYRLDAVAACTASASVRTSSWTT